MSSGSTYQSPYEIRVALVQGVLGGGTKLDKKAAHALAVEVLQVLDRIPEKMR